MHYSIGILMLWAHMWAEVFARAWGWGGWGGGWSSSGDSPGVIIIALIISAIYTWRRNKLLKKAKKDLEEAFSEDSSWDIDKLKDMTKEVFMKYQNLWTEKNIDELKNLSTKQYFDKASKVFEKQLNGKKNILKDMKISQMNIISVRDKFWKDGDMFTMEIIARMVDYTVDEETWDFVSSTLSKRKNESQKKYIARAKRQSSWFTEYWSFIRYNNTWRLMNINQKMSIIMDVVWLSHLALLDILKKESKNQDVDDNVFYKVD